MIFDATYRFDRLSVKFSCTLEDYDTDPVYDAEIYLNERPVFKDGALIRTDAVPFVVWANTPPRWSQRLLKVLMPKIVNMLRGNGPDDLRSWMDEQVLEQIEKERAALN